MSALLNLVNAVCLMRSSIVIITNVSSAATGHGFGWDAADNIYTANSTGQNVILRLVAGADLVTTV